MTPKPSKELAYFTGVICADGYVSRDGSIVEVKDDNKTFFEEVYIPIVRNLFNVTPHIMKERSCKNGYRCYTSVRAVSQFLKISNIVSPKTFTVRIPDWIINGPPDLKSSFLCGLIDSDGYIDVRRNKDILNYPTITLSSRSRYLADDVQKVMLSLGLNSKLSVYTSKGKPIYLVRLYGFNEFEKYMKLISFRNPKKVEKIHSLLSSGIIRIGE